MRVNRPHVLLLSTASAFVLACSESTGPDSSGGAPVQTVTVAPASAKLLRGATLEVSAQTRDAAGTILAGRTVTWGSSDPGVVTVSPSGLATGVGLGSASITATSEGKVGSGTVEVFVWTQLVSGMMNCGLTSAGTAHCWGRNSFGGLGDGTTTLSTVPTRVIGGLTFARVDAGVYHACGLTGTGDAYCWGYNRFGELGDGTRTDRSVPTRVLGGLAFTQIHAGTNFTCGLTSVGAAYCWGLNNLGQLGDGTTSGDTTVMEGSDRPSAMRRTPTLVQGGLSFKELSTFGSHTCGVTDSGAAYCWGSGANGELGDGTIAGDTVVEVSSEQRRGVRRTPSLVHGGHSFGRIAAGAGYSCGLTAAGAAYCWGMNRYGALGDGTTAGDTTLSTGLPIRWLPTPVAGGQAFVQVSAGNGITCALTGPGSAFCWGIGGSVGAGTTENMSSPTPVAGALTFASISAGSNHACAMTTSGAAYCWGYNFYGDLGDGTTADRLVPTLVRSPP